MQIEILIVAFIIFFVMIYSGYIDKNKLVVDNAEYLDKLKEDDWDFLVKAKYGDGVSSNVLFQKRLKNGLIGFAIGLCFFINNMSFLSVLISVIIGYVVYKADHFRLRGYYKAHLHEIDSMLPHYLKSIEILIQHYTVPVALGKSMNDAPEIFKEGLQELINQINAGDDTIDPYMEFAKTYPVRDSMRMMRLLYRLSLGRQERKQEQLIAFSKSISSLQQKARETKYKERLEKMESKTMAMLVTTGIGVMILLILAVLMIMNV